MASLGQQVSRNDLPQDGEFSPLPAGDYVAMIVESDQVPLKSGNGEMLKVVYEIVDGAGKGRKVFDNMNLWHNTSDKAREIAWSQLGRIMDALGLQNVSDTLELHNKPMLVSLTIDGDYNRIKKWAAVSGGATQQTTAAPVQQAATSAAAPAGGTPPWK